MNIHCSKVNTKTSCEVIRREYGLQANNHLKLKLLKALL